MTTTIQGREAFLGQDSLAGVSPFLSGPDLQMRESKDTVNLNATMT